MSIDRRVSWFINLLFSIFLILISFPLLIAPFSPVMRNLIFHNLTNHWVAIPLIGSFFFITGGLLFSLLLQSNSRYTYRFEGNLGGVMLDARVINGYVDQYWTKHFENIEISSQVIVKENQIEVVADLPSIPLVDQKPLLKKIERDLAELFEETLGYRKEYLLAISFPSERNDRIS